MIEKTAEEKAKTAAFKASKGQLAGVQKHNSLKDAFKSVEGTLGELHVQSAQKGKARGGR